MADNMSIAQRAPSTPSTSTSGDQQQPQMNPWQQASVAAVQKAISSGQASDPKLKNDLKAVASAKTPAQLHAAVKQLHQDAKADGIKMPQGGAGGAGKAKGGGSADADLGPDDLNVAGDNLKADMKTSGPSFGLNGGDSPFSSDGFQMGGRKLG
ncbi:MAG TPA: hypothetical protein VGO62_10190 [Myxococcota bacterium]|jgi:hypothetical protein